MGFLNKTFRYTLLFIFFVELLSLSAFLVPDFMPIAFLVVAFVALVLSIKNLEYGLLVLLAELFIGSKGHLFVVEFSGVSISIRIALWLIIMSVWLSKYVINIINSKSLNNSYFDINWFKKNTGPYFLILFLFILWGFINGLINNNNFNDIFFDVNGWLFFALFLPIYSVIKFAQMDSISSPVLSRVAQVFIAAIVWLSFKTLLLLYLFSHNFFSIIFEIYRWVRTSGVGEITQMQGGFYRIFFQSHIFVLIAFIVLLWILTIRIVRHGKINLLSLIKKDSFLLIIGAVLMAVNIISFSRSNWVGLVAGLVISAVLILYYYRLKGFLVYLSSFLATLIIGLAIIIIIVKFPFPDPLGGFDAGSLLTKRATQFTGEAALSSRWALFPEIWARIEDSPILGRGFGSSVTYISSDPRVLALTPTGEYTTTAFEWGWLDIWLKLGIFGIVIYVALIIKLFITAASTYNAEDDNYPKNIAPTIAIGLVIVAIISFFSPYLNHPLGIGYLLLVSALLNFNK